MKRPTLQAFSLRPKPSVCQFCQFSISSLPRQRPIRRQTLGFAKSRDFPNLNREWQKLFPVVAGQQDGSYRLSSSKATRQNGGSPESKLEDVVQQCRAITTAETLPNEQSVVSLLQHCRQVVDLALSDNLDREPEQHNTDDNATSSLLDLEGGNPSRSRSSSSSSPTKGNFRAKARNSISSILNELIQDLKVFISPKILSQYTDIQCRLKKVDYIPEAFSLYANKAAPYTSGSKIKYRRSNPNSPKNAIPRELAERALDVALYQKNLPLALAIVDSSFRTPAFRRAKVIRKASLPIVGAIAAPPAAYISASYFSTLQIAMDTSTATWIAFSGIMAYVAFTSSIGLVAITTSNDQMDRVVWLPGTALRQRWVREEERAAMDKIAAAWGFKDQLMRGTEQGQDWDNLREIMGMRGMVLDKTDLMEGME